MKILVTIDIDGEQVAQYEEEAGALTPPNSPVLPPMLQPSRMPCNRKVLYEVDFVNETRSLREYLTDDSVWFANAEVPMGSYPMDVIQKFAELDSRGLHLRLPREHLKETSGLNHRTELIPGIRYPNLGEYVYEVEYEFTDPNLRATILQVGGRHHNNTIQGQGGPLTVVDIQQGADMHARDFHMETASLPRHKIGNYMDYVNDIVQLRVEFKLDAENGYYRTYLDNELVMDHSKIRSKVPERPPGRKENHISFGIYRTMDMKEDMHLTIRHVRLSQVLY